MSSGNSNSGLLYLVGLGPGADKVLTPAARAALEDSDAVVGFRAYRDQVAGLLEGKVLVAMELGQELERAERAVPFSTTCCMPH